MTGLSAAEAVDRATAQTGLTDFGTGDLMEGLERTVAGFAKVSLAPPGRAEVDAMIINDLVKRLKIEDWYRTHPEIEETKIEGPLLVCGLPRTGTTATVAMFAEDPQFRFVRKWEAAQPIPPPVAAEEQYDPRRLAAHEEAKSYTLGALNLSHPDGPQEDLLSLAGLNMRSYHGSYPMPDDFIDWWLADDFQSTYAYHARTLKLLHSKRPPQHWLLKSPPHLFRLDAFAKQFPDAKFVWTHRDPAKIIPSVASLHQSLFDLRGVDPPVSKAWTSQRCLSFWTEGMQRGLAARDRIGDHRFVDVHNSDLVKDPIGTFERVYDQLGLTITPQVKASLDRYHQKNARGSHGAHEYSLEEYGLTRDRVRTAFKDYTERFEI